MTSTHDHDGLEDHDLGLVHDLPKILGRRGLLTVFGGIGVAAVAGCAADSSSSSSTTTPTSNRAPGGAPAGTSDVSVADGEIPEERPARTQETARTAPTSSPSPASSAPTSRRPSVTPAGSPRACP
jgi:hypothetical protein